MDEIDIYCDKVLNYLKQDKDNFFPPEVVLFSLHIPEEHLGSIVKILGESGLVDFHANHYKCSDIKITDKGIELTDGLCFAGTYGLNTDIKKQCLIKIEDDNKKSNERLELKQLKVTIQSLETQLRDHRKVRREARIAIIIAALAGLAGLAAIV